MVNTWQCPSQVIFHIKPDSRFFESHLAERSACKKYKAVASQKFFLALEVEKTWAR